MNSKNMSIVRKGGFEKSRMLLRTVCAGIVFMWVAAGAEDFDGWSISPDVSGNIRSMSYENPSTFLNIQGQITLEFEGGTLPTRGTVQYRNGFSGALTPQEALFYFGSLKGDKACWDYLQAKGKLIVWKYVQFEQIPQAFYGLQTRVVSYEGNSYIGKLMPDESNPFACKMEIEGNILHFKGGIREIQRKK
jgi:hypothetical protein